MNIPATELKQTIHNICLAYTNQQVSNIIADKTVLAEQMGIPTHGVHYFLHAILPHLEQGNIYTLDTTINGNIIRANGHGGIGYYNLQQCLVKGSHLAQTYGMSTILLNHPGKVGALRVFCQEFMDIGQLIIMTKNTARTMGTHQTRDAAIGTNPLCIGLPDTKFIYDASMSTVATNTIRLANKTGKTFNTNIGINRHHQPTCIPEDLHYLLPFSEEFWYKSFFLGVAIEGLAALSGGRTGARVGEHQSDRLFSHEGMFIFIMDHSAIPEYQHYQQEVAQLLEDLKAYGLRVPGDYIPSNSLDIYRRDLKELLNIASNHTMRGDRH